MRLIREVFLLILSLSPAAGVLLLYRRLPETMATHFGMNNEVNGTMSKASLTVLLVVLGLLPLFILAARLVDPKKANYEKFSTAFEVSRVGLTLLLTASGWMIIAYNLGTYVNMSKVVMFIAGLFFAVMGNYLTQVRQNYMVGIRTPWTLADEEIWRKTHRAAGPVMMAGGVVSLIAVFLSGRAAVIVFLAVIVVASIIPVIYSYVLYNRNQVK
jgi:uncharacterized membrane protein